MAFVSITRLRLRSLLYLPAFGLYTMRSLRQVKAAPGFQDGALLPDRSWTFWTMTVWDARQSMMAYMTGGAHKAAMPKLMDWCDEASVVHWEQASGELPLWTEADRRMRSEGRASKVKHPSLHHADLSYREPRAVGAGRIRPLAQGRAV